jgi:hypothetical protein
MQWINIKKNPIIVVKTFKGKGEGKWFGQLWFHNHSLRWLLMVPPKDGFCYNLSLGLVTKVRVCKSVGQKGSPGGTSYTPGNARECEKMNLHTPKWAPTLRVGVPMDSRIFKERLQGSKPIGLTSFLYHWKAIEM